MAKIMNTVQEETAVDSLRPYTDAEIPAAMKRMANDPTLGEMVAFAFPGIPLEAVREKLLQVRSADGFQQAFVQPMLENIIRKSSTGFTFGGEKHIARGEGHLFVSDHRDIVLDGALLQLVLLYAGLPTSEITFGSNLISWIRGRFRPFQQDVQNHSRRKRARPCPEFAHPLRPYSRSGG